MRYLKERKGWWHYVRRVPGHAAAVDSRGVIQIALKTRSADIAKFRRDALETADDLYWQGLITNDNHDQTMARYEAARARARVHGLEYKGLAQIVASDDVGDRVRRAQIAVENIKIDAPAVLGLIDEPRLSVTKAMEFYLDEVDVAATLGMSEKQKRKRREQKLAAAIAFAQVVADKVLLDVTRADANAYHRWWLDRIVGKDGSEPVSGNTANRAVGNMRKLFREYAKHLGLDLKNPFDDLSFAERKAQQKEIPPFETAYIRDTLLQAKSHGGKLNAEAMGIFLVVAETGCRPSEICNLRPSDIHLSAKVPYISVRFQDDRVIKTDSSLRDVPLIGVALAAMKRFPKGFPRYRNKEDSLSGVLMKHLRTNGLLPTTAHRVYSLRHSFEKRMLEAGLDYEFRRRILGHSVEREKYGDGGAMEWRRDQLLKIALPFDTKLIPP